MSKSRVVSMVFPVLVLGGAAAVSAAVVVDQEQSAIDLSLGNYAIGGGTEQVLGQTFTSGRGGWLSSVEMPVQCPDYSADGFVTLEIQGVVASGEPDDHVRATVTVSGSALSGDASAWHSFPVSGVLLSPGESYALVVRGDPANECRLTRPPVADVYAGGAAWYQNNSDPPGPGWHQGPWSEDLPFRVLVDDGTDPYAGSPFCHFRDASGTPNDWLPREVPVCRCLEDSAARAQRCFFQLPEAILIRELPWEGTGWIHARWSVLPLADKMPDLKVELESTTGALQGKVAVLPGGGRPLRSRVFRQRYWIDGDKALTDLIVKVEDERGVISFEDRRPAK